MLRSSLYYALKPYMPWHLRMAVRRVFARRNRRLYKDVWPIDESAGRAPAGWPGWPEEKKFAVVLTHDVEGPEGLEKCQRLAELEMKLGFHSSFNLIPEGPYTVPLDLCTWLTNHGFEIGVHDLHHDGKLYASRQGFVNNARRINHYLKEWGAAGFRSGFMLRNLDWIHDLDLRYDSSTFDTDPFELQPEGAGTIFPFWVAAPEAREARSAKRQEESAEALSQAARAQGKETEAPVQGRNTLGAYRLPLSAQPPYPLPLSAGFASSLPSPRSGYVELPYTLPQDSTLFLLLREKSPEIWLRKLDWIAAHGGMALVNVHPDYMDFAGTHRVNREYAATMYAELLRHVAEKHAGQFWNPLPKDLTTWFNGARCSTMRQGTAAAVLSGNIGRRGSSRVAGLRGKRAAVLLYSYYPSDPRPRRAAEAMIEAGMEVDLLCLSKDGSESPQELVNGVRVFRMPMKRRRESIWTYFRQYSRFLVASFWFLTRRDLRRRYDLIHVHNMPDALVFAALVPKLRGARIILDLHDPMPELMMSIYGLDPHEWSVRLLRRLERWSIRFANLVLTPNITFKNLFVSRSCPPEKLQIVMNSPQQEIFDSARLGITRPPGRNGTAFRIMHHGLIAHRHGIDLLVEAVARVRSSIPGVRLDIYGARTPFLDTVLAATDRLGVADIVHYHGEKTQADIARAIQESDLGVVPNRSSPFTELNFPTRIFEYLAMHRPVLAPATQGIKDYFSEDQLLMFEPGNVDDLTARILWIREHPDAARDLVTRGLEVYRQYLWQKERARFLDLLTATVR